MSSEVRCAFCYRTPEEIDYTMFKESWQSHDEYVIAEEGTYDPESEQFLCDACYIKLGQPSGRHPLRKDQHPVATEGPLLR